MMNKENNRSAAGLRRSAVVERLRLREEWSALKGTESQTAQNKNILSVKQTNNRNKNNGNRHCNKINSRTMVQTKDTLRGVVALVEVGCEVKGLPLRAALAALGATVLPAWSPLVTHVVWTHGGNRSIRAKARALASHLVSPLWVEACAGAGRPVPERAFPAAARASDLPSPRTLTQLLKKADMDNVQIADLLSESVDKPKCLRMSSDTDQDTSTDLNDTSHDKSNDTSRDKSHDTTLDIETRVNTAPRRALPKTSSISPLQPRPVKSKRKLFTQREPELLKSDEFDENTTMPKTRKQTKSQPKITKSQAKSTPSRRELARAERIARRIVAGCTPADTQAHKQTYKPRIVLTGMSREERRRVSSAVQALSGRLQAAVDRRTTHVLLGSFQRDNNDFSGVINLSSETCRLNNRNVEKPRTLNALLGAARGCRVLTAQWALDSCENKKWMHHTAYEVPHLKKISQKARVERAALGKKRTEYAYDIFNGMRVRISPTAEQKDAAVQLLTLCGAIVQDSDRTQDGGQAQNRRTQHEIKNKAKSVQNIKSTQYGVLTQNGVIQNGVLTQDGRLFRDYDLKIGSDNGEIRSKWVFDSVAAGRMRTTRRYVINSLSDDQLSSHILDK